MTQRTAEIDLSPPSGFLPAQEEARRLVEDASGPTYTLLSGGQGAGKTYWLAWQAIRLHFLNVQAHAAKGGDPRDIWGLAMAPTYGLLRRGFGISFDEVMAEAGLTGFYTWSHHEQIVKFRTGGGFHLFTAERPERIIAVNSSWAVVDEPGTPKTEDALRRVWGRMRGPGSLPKVAMAGTPEDIVTRQWFYDFIASPEAQGKYGAKGDNSRRIVFASTRQNTFLPNLETYVRGQEAVLTKAQRLAYLEGQFTSFNVGRVYSGYIDRTLDEGGHRIPEGHGLMTPPGRGNWLYLSLDFNVDPMCGVVAFPLGEDGVRVLDEIRIPKSSVDDGETPIGMWCAEAINRWLRDWQGPVKVFGDATAERSNVAASRTGWTMVHDCLRPVVTAKGLDYHVGVWGTNPREIDRVNTVNAAFEDRRILVAEKCVWLRKDLNLVGLKEGTSQIDKSDPTLTHMSDALGYLVVQRSGVLASRSKGPMPKVSTFDQPSIGETFDWSSVRL